MDAEPWPFHGYRMATIQFIPVRALEGGEVHATSLDAPDKTVCDTSFRGWSLCRSRLSCRRCKERLHMPVENGAKAVAR